MSNASSSTKREQASTRKNRVASLALALEPRFMYDAAGEATAKAVAKPVDDAAKNSASGSEADASKNGASGTAADVGPFGDKAAATLAALTTDHGGSDAPAPREIAFVDSRLPNISTLAPREGVEIVLLDANGDGVSQISETLSGRSNIKAIHIFTHGEEGEINLGATQLNAASLAGKAAEIASWSGALSVDADIMLWGCDVAKVPAGEALITSISALTGADVAASTDATGSEARGGNWTLESKIGAIETGTPFESASISAWNHLLDPPSITEPAITSLTVIEPSTLNNNGPLDSMASLGGWDFQSSADLVTVTAVLSDTSIGTIERNGSLGTAIAGGWTFTGTLADANAWLDSLSFVAADRELGATSARGQITLTIDDGGGLTADRTIDVTVTPSNDPTLLSPTISQDVTEGASSTIITALTRTGLSPTVVDQEVGTGSGGYQTTNQIVYRLLEAPVHGYLTLNGQRIGVGSIFTQADIEANRVRYTHTATDESQNTSDSFRVSASDGATPLGASSESVITLNILPVNSAPTVQSRPVTVFEGQPWNATGAAGSGRVYETIGQQIVLGNGGDPSSDTLSVTITSLPTQGQLYYDGVLITTTGLVIAHSDLGKLSYQHNGNEPGGNPSDSFGIIVTDSGGGTGVPSSINNTIAIDVLPVDDDPVHNGLPDVPGNETANAVPIGGSTIPGLSGPGIILTDAMLNITDVDSPTSTLTFNIKTLPTDGHILLRSGGTWYRLQEGNSFSMADVLAGNVAYFQTAPNVDGSNPFDSFTYIVLDGAKRLVWDADGVDFTRVGGVHDNGGNSQTDALTTFRFNIELAQTEGGNWTGEDFPVIGAPFPGPGGFLGDNPTVAGPDTQFNEGGTAIITSGMLSHFATGAVGGGTYTAPPEQIVYTVETLPRNGILQVFRNGSWVDLGSFGTFTQADINNDSLRFVHDGSEIFSSFFSYSVIGGGNAADGQPLVTTGRFDIYATPVNDAPYANGSQDNVLSERDTSAPVSSPADDRGGVRYITAEMLNFGDPDDAISENYIENPASDTYLNNPGRNNGSVASGGEDFKPLQIRFTNLPTQGELQYFNGTTWVSVQTGVLYTLNTDPNNTGGGAAIIVIGSSAGNTGLRYVHDGSDSVVRTDEFNVEVVDHFGATASTEVSFQITPVNDAPQVVLNNTVVVYEGQARQISIADFLDLSDPDSSNEQVQVRITEATKYGMIVRDRNGTAGISDGQYDVIGVGSSFTYADLIAGRIYYIQDGTDNYQGSGSTDNPPPQDGFRFTLSDGAAETVGNSLTIQILPTNDAPKITGVPTEVRVISGSSDPTDEGNRITTIRISDVDVESRPNYESGAVSENSEMQVTVRLRAVNSDGTTGALLSDYSGISFGYGATDARVVSNGAGTVLTLYGTLAEINAALAGLSIAFNSDRNSFYQVEVIADDRTRNSVDNSLAAGPRANGGEGNAPTTAGGDPSPINTLDPNAIFGDFTNPVLAGNVALASFRIYASSVNNAPTITYPSTPVTPTEDTNVVIINSTINRVVIGDTEAQALGTNVRVTLTATNGTIDVSSIGSGQSVYSVTIGSTTHVVTIAGDRTGNVVLVGSVAGIQSLLDTGIVYRGTADFNGTDQPISITIDDLGNSGQGTADNQSASTSIDLLDSVDVNDKPTLNVGSGTIYLSDTVTNILGPNTITDRDGDGFVQVTVRLLQGNDTPFNLADYAGIAIGYAGGLGVVGGYDGQANALVLQGSVSDVNAALAGLSLSYNAALSGDARSLKLQIVVDDRMRDASGALTGGANGGAANQTNTNPADSPTPVDSSFDVTPYSALPSDFFNIVAQTRNLFISGVNDPATISAQDVVVDEGGSTIVLNATRGAITVTDIDNGGQPTISATVTLPPGYTFTNVGGSGGTVVINGGTVTITDATPAQLQSRLQALTIQLPDPAGGATAADFNGGNFTVTIVINDGGSIGDRPGSVIGGDPTQNPGQVSYADGPGGTSAALITTRIINVTVNAVNDAPEASSTAPITLPSISEDGAGQAHNVSSLFLTRFTDAKDSVQTIPGGANPTGSVANQFAGIAIVGNAAEAAKGAWEYRVNGTGPWISIGARTLSSALILGANDEIRFVPAENYFGPAPTLQVRLMEDGGSTSVPDSGTILNLSGSATGGATRYSASAHQISVNVDVTAVNDRPSIIGSGPVGVTTSEDTTSSTQTIGSLVNSRYGDATDNQTANNDLSGGAGSTSSNLAFVAITANSVQTSQGHWEWYNTATSSWVTIPTSGLSDTSALVLAANTQIRFVPAADFNGTPGQLTVRLADSDTGSAITASANAGDLKDLNTVGDLGSQQGRWTNDTLTIQASITSVNDRPVAGNATLPSFDEDTTPSSQTVTELFGGSYQDNRDNQTDVPGGINTSGTSIGGIAIVGNTANATTEGAWQYFNGTIWQNIGSVSTSNALLLTASTALRFVPVADYNGTPPALSVHVSDQPITSISRQSIQTNLGLGQTSQWSTLVTLGVAVNSVEDNPRPSPDVDQIMAGTTSVGKNAVNGVLRNDGDPDAGQTISVVGIVAGTSGTPSSTGVNTTITGTYGSLVLQADGSYVYTLDNNNATVRALPPGQTLTEVFTYTVSDDGGVSTPQISTLTITINGINDAPVIVDGGSTVGGREDGIIVLDVSDFNFSDVDTGDALEAIEISTLPTSGTLYISGVAITATTVVSRAQIEAGLLTYSPAVNGNGDDYATFTYRVSDGDTYSAIGTMTVDIAPRNDLPTVAGPNTAATAEDMNLAFDGGSGAGHAPVLTIDDAIDLLAGGGATDFFTVTLTITNGTITVSDPGDAITGEGTGTTLTLTGTRSDLNAALATLVYSPTGNFSGSAQLTLVVNDHDNGGTGDGAISGTVQKVVDISIAPVSDAPSLALLPASGNEDGWIPLDITASSTDSDGSETITVDLSGLPAGWSIRVGTGTAVVSTGVTQVLTFSAADLATGLSVRAPDNVNTATGTPIPLSITARSVDGSAAAATTTGTLNVTVIPVNDRPAASGSATLPSVAEDTANPPGQSVTSLFGGNYSDQIDDSSTSLGADRDTPLAGVAIVGNAALAAQGVWQYDLGDGNGWRNIPTTGLGASSALILPASANIRFVPAPDFAGVPGKLTAYLSDGTGFPAASTTPSDRVDLASVANGSLGSQAGGWSQATVDLGTTVTTVNDRPVAQNATLPDFDEDTTPPARTVSQLFQGGYSDTRDNSSDIAGGIDTSSPLVGGLAVIGNSTDPVTEGSWQYFDGTAWRNIPTTVSESGAILLTANTQIRFQPVTYYNGTPPALEVRISDSAITTIATGVPLMDVGATSQWSEVREVSVTIDPVNNAPVISAGGNTVTGTEDTDIVFAVADFNFSDVDTGDTLQAITVTTLPGQGALYLDGVLVNAGDIISRADIVAGKLIFRPDADENGNGYTTFNYTVSDGLLSSTSGTMAVNITPINDRPIGSGTATLPGISEDDGNPAGSTVSDLFNGCYSDIADDISVGLGTDNDTPLAGIAIVGNLAQPSQGTWQYDLGDGQGWRNIPSSGLGDTHALILPAAALLRFVPATDFNGEPGRLVVRLSDGTAFPTGSATPGALVDITDAANGGAGTQAGGWSVDTVDLAVNVSPVNDAPVIEGHDIVVDEGSSTISLSGAFKVTDVDLGNGLLTATLIVPEGYWFSGIGGSGGSISGLGTGKLVISGVTQAQLQSRLDSLIVRLPGADGSGPGTATKFSGSFSVSLSVSDNGSTGSRPSAPVSGHMTDTNDPRSNPGDFAFVDGTSSDLVTTRIIQVTVRPVSDAPLLNTVDARGPENSPGIPLKITIGDMDQVGPPETLTVVIAGIPAGWVLRSGDIVILVSNGTSAPIDPARLANLTIAPPRGWNSVDDNGGRPLSLTVTGYSSDQGAAAAFTIGRLNIYIDRLPNASLPPPFMPPATPTPTSMPHKSTLPSTSAILWSAADVFRGDYDGWLPGIEARSLERVATTWQTVSHQLFFEQRDPLRQGPLFYEARMADRMPLPAWISFDPSTQTITATPSDAVYPGVYVIRVVARDASGNEAVATLTLHVLREQEFSKVSVSPKGDGEMPPAPVQQKLDAAPPIVLPDAAGQDAGSVDPAAPVENVPQTPETDSNGERRSELPTGKPSLSTTLLQFGLPGQIIEAARFLESLSDDLPKAS